MKLKKAIQYLLVFMLVFSFSVVGVSAADFRVGEKTGGSISIGADESVKNLYTAGNIVSVEADVEKGLYAGGNAVTINGDVENTLNAGGGTLIVNGDVGGSMHGAGGTVVVGGKIADDLFIGGGNISITKSAAVGGDLILGAGTANIQAPIAGDVYLSGGEVFIDSEIGGDVVIESVEKLKLGSNAIINGNLKYNSPKEAEIDDNASILGTIDYNNPTSGQTNKKENIAAILFAIISIGILIKLVGAIIVGLVFIYLFKRYTKNAVTESLTKFWPSLGIGFAALFLTPIVIILLLFTVVGIWLAIMIALIYILSIFIAASLAPIIFGSWLIKILKKNKSYAIGWLEVVAGVIVLMLVGAIPFIGWIVGLVFMLISLGALYKLVYKAITTK